MEYLKRRLVLSSGNIRLLYKWWGSVSHKIMDAFDCVQDIPPGVLQSVVTSPPYWQLRSYDSPSRIFDGDDVCKHSWIENVTAVPNMSGGEFGWKEDATRHWVDYDDRNLRSEFCEHCGAWRGCLGFEPTFDLFVKHLADLFERIGKSLSETGTMFINIGDTYSSGGNGQNPYPAKSLTFVPFRFATEMVKRGFVCRNVLIWKKNCVLPSSATSRFTVDFEYVFFFSKSSSKKFWVHPGKMLVVGTEPEPDYVYEDLLTGENFDREPDDYSEERMKCPECYGKGRVESFFGLVDCELCSGRGSLKRWRKRNQWEGHDYYFEQQFDRTDSGWFNADSEPRGRNKRTVCELDSGFTEHLIERLGPEMFSKLLNEYSEKDQHNNQSVVTVNPANYRGAHSAVYPPALIEPFIKAGTPEFVCKMCGLPKVKIYEDAGVDEAWKKRCGADSDGGYSGKAVKDYASMLAQDASDVKRRILAGMKKKKFKGYAECSCGAGFEQGVVFDPFLGSGTTIEVARKLNRQGIGCELNPDYDELIRQRTLCMIPRLESFDDGDDGVQDRSILNFNDDEEGDDE